MAVVLGRPWPPMSCLEKGLQDKGLKAEAEWQPSGGRWGTEAKANLLAQNEAVMTAQVPRNLDQVFVLV